MLWNRDATIICKGIGTPIPEPRHFTENFWPHRIVNQTAQTQEEARKNCEKIWEKKFDKIKRRWRRRIRFSIILAGPIRIRLHKLRKSKLKKDLIWRRKRRSCFSKTAMVFPLMLHLRAWTSQVTQMIKLAVGSKIKDSWTYQSRYEQLLNWVAKNQSILSFTIDSEVSTSVSRFTKKTFTRKYPNFKKTIWNKWIFTTSIRGKCLSARSNWWS